jgi:hypothetical protein
LKKKKLFEETVLFEEKFCKKIFLKKKKLFEETVLFEEPCCIILFCVKNQQALFFLQGFWEDVQRRLVPNPEFHLPRDPTP